MGTDIVTFAKRNISRIAWALLAYELVMQTLGMGIQLVVKTMPLSQQELLQAMLMVNGLVQYAVALPIAALIMKPSPAMPARKLSFTPRRYFSLLAMCYPVMVIGSWLGESLSAYFSDGQAQNRITQVLLGDNIWWTSLWVGVAAPIFEELLFRKLLIDRLRGYGEKLAIVLSALAFGLFHTNLYQFFYTFGLGLLFGYIYVRSSKLVYTIAAHMLLNLTSSLLVPLLLSGVDQAQLEAALSNPESLSTLNQSMSDLVPLMIYGLVVLALFIVGLVLLIAQRKRFVFFKSPWQLPKGSVASVLASPGVVIYTIVGVVCTVAFTLL